MSPVRMSRLESAIRVVLKFNEAFNRHNIPAMLDLLSQDCSIEASGPGPDGTSWKGREQVRAYFERYFAERSGVRIDIEETFSAGWRCVVRGSYAWGEKGVNHIRGLDLYVVKEGLIAERLSYIKGID